MSRPYCRLNSSGLELCFVSIFIVMLLVSSILFHVFDCPVAFLILLILSLLEEKIKLICRFLHQIIYIEMYCCTHSFADSTLFLLIAGKMRGKHMGCFIDSRESRILRGHATQLKRNTPSICCDICYQRGYVYAGVQYG